MATQQQANTPLIVTIGVVSGLMLLVIMFGVEAWFKYEEKQELAAKWEDAQNVQLDNMRAAQAAHLNGYRWAYANKEAAMMPIDAAMQIIVEKKGKMPTTQPKPESKK